MIGQVEKSISSNFTLADWNNPKKISTINFSPYAKGSLSEHFEVFDKGFLELGDECMDIRSIHNIADYSQLTAIGLLIRKIEIEAREKLLNIKDVVEYYIESLKNSDLDEIYSSYFTNCSRWLELPRKFEVLALLHRMRYLTWKD